MGVWPLLPCFLTAVKTEKGRFLLLGGARDEALAHPVDGRVVFVIGLGVRPRNGAIVDVPERAVGAVKRQRVESLL